MFIETLGFPNNVNKYADGVNKQDNKVYDSNKKTSQSERNGKNEVIRNRLTFEQKFRLYLQHQEQKYHSQHASCTK